MRSAGPQIIWEGGNSMKLKFKCTNGLCREKNEHEHRLDLPAELVMDEKNIAVMYCPKCKRKLKQLN